MTHLAYKNEPNELLTKKEVGMNMSPLSHPQTFASLKVVNVSLSRAMSCSL